MPAPATVQVVEEIEQAVSPSNIVSRGVPGVIDLTTRLAERGAASAAAELSLGEAPEVIAATSVAADALFVFVIICVLLALVAIVYLVLYVVLLITRAVEGIGIFGIGHKIAGYMVTAEAPLVAAATALSSALSSNLSRVMREMASFVHWAISYVPTGVKDPIKVVVDLEIQGWVRQLQELQTVVYGMVGVYPAAAQPAAAQPSGIAGELVTIKAQLAQAEARNNAQGLQISQLNQRVGHAEQQLQVVGTQLEQLRVTVYGARNSVVGVQDLVHQVDVLRQTVMTEQAALRADVTVQGQRVSALEPLGVLMYLGERGLQNLRNLEDNPCQCPSLPNFGSLTPDMLAIYEFVTNG